MIQRCMRTVPVLVTALMIAGCPGGPNDYRAARYCDGFDRAMAADWTTRTAGSRARFISATGASVGLTFVKEMLTEPGFQHGFGEDSEVACIRTGIFTAVSDDGTVSYREAFSLVQMREGQPSNQQQLRVEIRVYPTSNHETYPELRAYPPFNLSLDQLTDRQNNGLDPYSGTVTNAYYPSRAIAGRSYTDVLESSLPIGNPELARQPLTAAAWRRVVIARGVGLVQFELRDGTVFDRQP